MSFDNRTNIEADRAAGQVKLVEVDMKTVVKRKMMCEDNRRGRLGNGRVRRKCGLYDNGSIGWCGISGDDNGQE